MEVINRKKTKMEVLVPACLAWSLVSLIWNGSEREENTQT